MLNGGLEEWKARILFPRIPENPTPAQVVEFARVKEVSKFFGGIPQTGTGDATAGQQFAMPKLELPAPGAAGPVGAPKKKKEGC